MRWDVIGPEPNGGYFSERFFWWVRATKWRTRGDAGTWVYFKLFVGPGAYDRAKEWSNNEVTT